MNTSRRLLTPIAASIVAGLVVALATVGGSMTGDRAAVKTDRFAETNAALCANQQWPNLSNKCLAWSQGEIAEGAVRYVTVVNSDTDAGITTLARVPAGNEAF